MTSRKKIFGIISIFVLSILAVLFVPEDIFESDDPTPGELEGVWYHKNINCMDGPYTIWIFENGEGFKYSSVHQSIEPLGTYKKLPDGKYELTKQKLVKTTSPIYPFFKKRFNDSQPEGMVQLENGDIHCTSVTILEPHKKYMPAEIIEKFKLKRVTDVPKFHNLYLAFKKLLKEKGVDQEE